MRDPQFQTPQKDQITENRRSKSTPDLRKKHRKSLNPAFAAISEETVSDFTKESKELCSPISAVSVDSHVRESSENSITSLVDSDVASTSQTIVHSDQAPSSPKSVITSDEDKFPVALVPKCENPEMDSVKNTLPVEAEMVIKHLTAVRIKVSKSEVEYKSRKFLDVLLEAIIQEFHGDLYKERGLVHQLLTSKATLIFLSFMLGVLTVIVLSFLRFGENGHSTRPPPT